MARLGLRLPLYSLDPSVPVGNHLVGYLSSWRLITAEAWVLKVAEKAYVLLFRKTPHPSHGPSERACQLPILTLAEVQSPLAPQAFNQVEQSLVWMPHISPFSTVPT